MMQKLGSSWQWIRQTNRFATGATETKIRAPTVNKGFAKCPNWKLQRDCEDRNAQKDEKKRMGVRSSICVCVCICACACICACVCERQGEREVQRKRHDVLKAQRPQIQTGSRVHRDEREKKISASTLENKIEPMLYFLDFEQKSHKLKLGKCKCGA